MNRNSLTVSFVLVALLLATPFAVAETGSGSHSDSGKAMESELKIAAQNTSLKVEIRERAGDDRFRMEHVTKVKNALSDLDDSDAHRLVALNVDVEKLLTLDAQDRIDFLERLRAQFDDAHLEEYRLRMKRIEDRDQLVERIRIAKSEDNAAASLRQRLLLLNEISDDDALKIRAAALRLRLENATTVSPADAAEAEAILKEHRTDTLRVRAGHAVEHADALSVKLSSFLERLDAKVTGMENPPENIRMVLFRLGNVQTSLNDSIASVKRAYLAVEDVQNPSNEELRTLHSAMVEMNVHAKQSVSAMRTVVQWVISHQNGNDSADLRRRAAESIAIRSTAVIDAEVSSALAETTANAVLVTNVSSSDDSSDDTLEIDDSGNDSLSDMIDDVMEDHTSGSDDE